MSKKREVLEIALMNNPGLHPFAVGATMDGIVDDPNYPGGVVGPATYCDHFRGGLRRRPPRRSILTARERREADKVAKELGLNLDEMARKDWL